MSTRGISHRRLWTVLGAVSAVFLTSNVYAVDYALTIGGGYSPTGNQVSLEKNTQYFQRVLERFYPKYIDHTILFADGQNPQRDLQYRPLDSGLTPARRTLATIFGQTRYLYDYYRNHEIDRPHRASSRLEFERWIDRMTKEAKAGDRIIIYATAHGGKSNDKNAPFNTKLYLWNRQSLTMRDFTKQLDRLPVEVPVCVVMVQCYSGGFSHFIYQEGDPQKGLSPQPRCGFFATTHDRVAAGCTSDIKEEDYHEYSTYFWSALLGESRRGEPVHAPDLDGDGTISFAEAHAFALQESITIDISICTSDVLLRQYSKLPEKEDGGLYSIDTDFEQLLASATPEQASVARALSKQLGISAPKRGAAVKQLLKKTELEKKQLGKSGGSVSSKQRQLAGALRAALLKQWPELQNPWHAQVAAIVDNESDAVMAFLKKQPQYREFVRYQQESKQKSDAVFELDRRIVKCRRLQRCLENMALLHNLDVVGTSEEQTALRRIMQLERQSLGTPRQ